MLAATLYDREKNSVIRPKEIKLFTNVQRFFSLKLQAI